MSITIPYTFYVEINGQSVDGLTPTVTHQISIETGVSAPTVPTVSELGEGFYKFEYTWDETNLSEGFLLKIDTGADSDVGRIITMRIDPQDYLPNVAKTLKESSDLLTVTTSLLQSTSEDLDAYVKRLLDIEQGTWKIEGTVLKLYSAGYGSVAAGQLIASYDLYDANGIATNINPFERRLNTLVGTVTP